MSAKPIAKTPGSSTLTRPKFGAGMLLQHDDLEQLGAFPAELSRLLFRSLFGCGVVCGLVVVGEEKCGALKITVGCGFALDGNGDPIEVPRSTDVTIGGDCDDIPSPLWVVLCKTTKSCAPRASAGGCGDDDDEPLTHYTRARDGFEIRVVAEKPECACGCNDPAPSPDQAKKDAAVPDDCLCADPKLDCHQDHYAGRCGCGCKDEDDAKCKCGSACVILARLTKPTNGTVWTADHQVRRFIRPVLMRDPVAAKEVEDRKNTPPTGTSEAAISAYAAQATEKRRSRAAKPIQ